MRILITGNAGFIGFHLSELLLRSGYEIVGVDNLSEYYSVSLKEDRLAILKKYKRFYFEKLDISSEDFLNCELFKDVDCIVHLAAQAGVRHSIDDPKSYTVSNLLGSQNILELARQNRVKHLLMASTSSVYGANTQMPFNELQQTDSPLSYYAATKKSNEIMAHSYSHIFKIPITMFRFFTVYGPWGRPDMALFKFTKNILDNVPIDVYNDGKMFRDFTYIGDLVQAISKLIECVPLGENKISEHDRLSKVAPYRIVNIGNSRSVALMDYIDSLERALEKKAIINFLPMQIGDVERTEADTALLMKLTGYVPDTSVDTGIQNFVKWYQSYHG